MTPTRSTPRQLSPFVTAEEDAALRAQGFRPIYLYELSCGQDYYGGLFDSETGETAARLSQCRYVLAFNQAGVFLLAPPAFTGWRIEDRADLFNMRPHLVTMALTS